MPLTKYEKTTSKRVSNLKKKRMDAKKKRAALASKKEIAEYNKGKKVRAKKY